jgi:alpha-glucoside transport system substrate-binding protein
MHLTTSRRRLGAAAITLPLLVGLGLAGCASDEQAGAGAGAGGSDRTDASLYEKAVAKAKDIAGDAKLDSSLEYIGPNGGAEGEVLQSVYKAFTEATGTKVKYTGTQDTSIVQSRVQAGNPPDIADLQIGVAQDYAKQGLLMDLSDVIGNDELKANYNQGLLDGASNDGSVFGVYQGFNNFMLWYNPESYTGPKDPKTWQEVVDWTDKQAADGTPTWCIAEEAGGGSGFPGAQFIENLFAKKYGPEKLRQWGSGELAWTSPEVKDAWEMFGSIATDDSKVSGGVQGSLSAAIATGYNGLTSDPATCQMALWGSWVPGLIGETAKPGENIDFFRIPGDSEEFANTEIFQTTVAVGFNDTPTTEAFLRFIESTEAQALLASADQWPVANVNVPTDTYDSELLQKSAETFFSDDVTLAVGPNVMADTAVGTAFWKGVVSYLQDPSSLDTVLAGIQSAQTGS